MKRFLILAFLATASSADPLFYNPTGRSFSVVVTQPNGEKVTDNITPGISNMGSRSTTLPTTVLAARAEVLDDLGASLWKGKVKNETCYIIVSDGTQLMEAGFYSGDNYLKAAHIANLTGIDFAVDFIGQYGQDAQRGLHFGGSFDAKKVFRFHPKEDTYKVRLTDPQGSVYECGNTLSSGRYHVLFKNNEGKFEIGSAGCIKR